MAKAVSSSRTFQVVIFYLSIFILGFQSLLYSNTNLLKVLCNLDPFSSLIVSTFPVLIQLEFQHTTGERFSRPLVILIHCQIATTNSITCPTHSRSICHNVW